MAKFTHGKFGLKDDPRFAHVTMEWKGRTLLGMVRDLKRDEVCGCIRLDVYHFNGEPWPVRPSSYAVDVLERN